jgi:hypothetical protein
MSTSNITHYQPGQPLVDDRSSRLACLSRLITVALFCTIAGQGKVHSNTQLPAPGNMHMADVDGDGVADWVGYESSPGSGYLLSMVKTDPNATRIARIDRTAYTGNTASITRLFTGRFRSPNKESVCTYLYDSNRVQCFELGLANIPNWYVDQTAYSGSAPFFPSGFYGSEIVVGDFDGDSLDEVLLYNRSNGTVRLMKYVANDVFHQVVNFLPGNLGDDAAMIAGCVVLVGNFANFNSEGTRDDLLVYNPRSGQISEYDARRDPAGRTTFWIAFRTRYGVVSAAQDITIADVQGFGYEACVLRDRTTGAISFRRMGTVNSTYDLDDLGRGGWLIAPVMQGNIAAAGSGYLMWGKMNYSPSEPGGSRRDDVFLYTTANVSLVRFDARYDSNKPAYTYWYWYERSLGSLQVAMGF